MLPPLVAQLMAPFRLLFTAPVWHHVLVLIAGATLAPGKRTVCSALRVMGLGANGDFALYHHVLSRARWGARIAARGIYRDPVRSSGGHFVKTSGLRWLALMAMVPVLWAKRRWALPFLTVLAPSERYNTSLGRRHKTLTDWARQAILQVRRWLPGRSIIVTADSSLAAPELIEAVRRHVTFITRLRLDAALYAPPPERNPNRRGRPAKRGARLPKLSQYSPQQVRTQFVARTFYELGSRISCTRFNRLLVRLIREKS